MLSRREPFATGERRDSGAYPSINARDSRGTHHFFEAAIWVAAQLR